MNWLTFAHFRYELIVIKYGSCNEFETSQAYVIAVLYSKYAECCKVEHCETDLFKPSKNKPK